MNNVHTLIIPDVHGRTFWKDAVKSFPKDEYPDLRIVFLGDYLDPYENYAGILEGEGVSREDAILNFEEIIRTRREDDRICLLIGNHDMHYFYDARFKSRVDNKNYDYISKLFESNMDIFKVAYEENVNGQRYLYTHAGVTSYWVNHLHIVGNAGIKAYEDGDLSEEQLQFTTMLANIKPTADELNMLLDNFQGRANLWMASWIRGGDYNDGSCIWADLQEWAYENANIPDVYQIFGHTLFGGSGPDDVVIRDDYSWAMLDSRQAWTLSNEGKLISLKNLTKDNI